MALDRQKILNELGSVVNQLQSADCGCMGKLFTNSGQENYNPGPMACQNGGFNMQGHHGHGYGHGFNSPCAGEPCGGGRPCMGFCDPPKLYSDTYNYLNHNLMQPVVQEVYQDLKSINPDNTIMNSPMDAQLGMPAANNPNQGNMGQQSMPGGPMGNANMNVGHAHVPHVHFGNMAMNNPNAQGMGQMGHGVEHTGHGHMGYGMGQEQGMSQIGQEQGMVPMGQEYGHVQMGQGHGMGQMVQGQGMTQMGQGQGMDQRQLMGQMGQRQGMDQMGQEQGMGQMAQGMGQRGHEMGHMHHGMDRQGDMGQNIMKMMTSSNARSNKTPNIGMGNPSPNAPGNMHQSPEMGHMAGGGNQEQFNSGQMQNNPGYMQMGNMQQGRPGMQTTQYMSQPNSFPGAAGGAQSNQMQGNMNQMVPGSRPTGNTNAKHNENYAAYGQHSTGIAKFNEMFPGVMKEDLGFDPMAIAIQMNPANQQKSAMDTMEKLMMNNSRGLNKVMDNQGNASPHMEPVIKATNAASASLNQPYQPPRSESPTRQRIPEPQRDNNQISQQVYYQQNDQVPQRLYVPQQQQMIDPNTGAVITNPLLATVYEGSEEPAIRSHPHSHAAPPTAPDTYKDPLLPADTSRNLLQSHHFHHHKPPKFCEYNTIGQPVERHFHTPGSTKYSNVKPTVSKTALVGNKPIGRTPSRSQQQVIYNQYKGSQSVTRHNILTSPPHNVSHSDPRIALPQQTLQAPIERHSGDSAANDVVAPVDVKFPNLSSKQAAEKNFKQRNGLQDQIFSAYPSSAKWSFHGNNNAPPYSVGYRFRAK